MVEKFLFSIIVPAYNAERHIGICLDTLLGLAGDDYEVVVIDDGSCDSTAAIVKDRIDTSERLRLFSQENSGVYYARRAGCKVASGEYCLFVDADDRVESNILSKLRPALAGKPDMVVFNAFAGDGPLCDGEWLCGLDLAAARHESIAGHLMNPIWNKCIRRELVVHSYAENADELLVYGEDAIQIASVLDLCESVVGLDVLLYRYKSNDESVTSTIDPKLRFEQAVRKQEILTGFMNKWELSSCLAGYNSICLIYCADYCKALAKLGDAQAIARLGHTAFFINAACNYVKGKLTRNQRLLIGLLRFNPSVAARLLCLIACKRGVN